MALPTPACPTDKPNRLYMVEFLRIGLMLLIFFLHVMNQYPEDGKKALAFLFGSAKHHIGLCVECFFIIGGFFLYKRLMSDVSPFEQIKRTWLRLAPGLLFAFLLCVCLCKVRLVHLPTILTLAVGTGQAAPFTHVLKCGDWFVGVYFWVSCLLLGIFQLPKRMAFLALGALMYAAFSMYLNHPKWVQDLVISPLVGITNAGMIRGVYSMGLGVIMGFLAQHIALPQRWWAKLLGTAFEVWCLATVFIFIARPHHCHQSYWEVLATMALLLLSISQSWGYLSQLLNKCARIQYVSRYVFPALMGHMVMMRLLDTYHQFNLDFTKGLILVIGGSITLGVMEYHLVERYLLRKIRGN